MFCTEFKSNQLNQFKGKMPSYSYNFEYMRATVSLIDSDDVVFCLGTAFHPQLILTTTTCVHNRTLVNEFQHMYIWVGNNVDPQVVEERFVYNIYHSLPLHRTLPFENDIAIIVVNIVKHS